MQILKYFAFLYVGIASAALVLSIFLIVRKYIKARMRLGKPASIILNTGEKINAMVKEVKFLDFYITISNIRGEKKIDLNDIITFEDLV